MKNIKNTAASFFLIAIVLAWFSCKKPNNDQQPAGSYKLSYGDSILHLKTSGSSVYFPTEHRTGTYSAFPEGIDINDVTGAINLDNSETGLRYRITHTSPDGTVTTTMVVLSGINFPDWYHRFSQNDTMSIPLYNARTANILPVSGSVFDEGNIANSGGCSIRTDNGKINLAQCVRNGVFGSTPQNNVRRDFDIIYRLNDNSNKSQNRIRVRLYWYNTMADVPADVLELMQVRQDEGVFLRNGNSNVTNTTSIVSRVSKPRPPCIVIIAN